MVKPENHVANTIISDTDVFHDEVQKLRDNGNWVVIDTNDNRKYFYVGKIISSNPQELVMMVVDMNGRFGGYVWIRYQKVIRFETADEENFVGYPTSINLATGVLNVELLDVDDNGDLPTKQVGIENIREMAFDYFKAFLTENEID